MAKLGKDSLAVYATLAPGLRTIVDDLLPVLTALGLDLKLIQGHRTHEQQAALPATVTQVKPGHSKHEAWPSLAVDMAIYPVRWKDEVMFGVLNGLVQSIAVRRGVKVRWGGDWDGDGDTLEHTLRDLDHWELVS